MGIEQLGWNDVWESRMQALRGAGWTPARVVCDYGLAYTVCGNEGELSAEVSGKMRHDALTRSELPVVGDWVAVAVRSEERAATIQAVLPRRSKLSRQAAGQRTDEQVIAANVDVVFLVNGMDGDFNVRRIERYLALAWESGARPVVVLNKADLSDDLESRVQEVESVAFGVPVLAVSALEGRGIVELATCLQAGETAAFLGSSGVGKSSLINALIGGARLTVQSVREDDSRGRHTTTHRELLMLADGGMVIDTPGLREVQLWTDEESLGRVFGDVEALAVQCRFGDCTHGNEPGCAVRAAIEGGELDADRFRSYEKLRRELQHAAGKQDYRVRMLEKSRVKRISKEIRRIEKARDNFRKF